MSSLNNCQFIGRLGKDPEVKAVGGSTVANFSIACDEKWKDKNGVAQQRCEWVRIAAWGKLAELCGEYLRKGRQVYVSGRMSTREYEKDGQKRYSTEIVADKVVFLGSKGDGGQQHDSEREAGSDDDLAF
jgi:single-strand DNA-binding protein